jgi:hypothetical protein
MVILMLRKLSTANCPSRLPKQLGKPLDPSLTLSPTRPDAFSLATSIDASSAAVTKTTPSTWNHSRLSQLSFFDGLCFGPRSQPRPLRSIFRRSSTMPPEYEEAKPLPPRCMTALELRDSAERSARLDTMLKADASKDTNLKILTLGHRRSALTKQLRTHFGTAFDSAETDRYRQCIIKYVVTNLLQLVEDVENNGVGFATQQARHRVQGLKRFSEGMKSVCVVDKEVSTAAISVWRNYFVQQAYRHAPIDSVAD